MVTPVQLRAAVKVVHVTPVELCGLLHHVQASLLHLPGYRLLLSIVRRQVGHHALKIIVALLPDNTTVEDRRRFYIERQDLGSHVSSHQEAFSIKPPIRPV